jgi:hypothetical protein
MLTQKEFVEGCYNYYREADLQPGNPEDGDWNVAHYPVPECKEGTETVLLLREHHAVQGVLQSEEFQWNCFFDWEKNYLSGELLELFYKWKSEGVKLQWKAKTEEEKVLHAEKGRSNALAQWSRMTEEEKVLHAEKGRSNTLAYYAQVTEEEKRIKAEKCRAKALASHARKRFEKEVDDLVAVWEMGLRWG